MPNNVYIGSRYVPIFDGDWNNTKVYEPLTIVNYNGGSYTSKQNVPAGTLPTNTTYWALTGNYNGQISNLQQQITTIDSNIGDMSDLDTSATNLVAAINEVLSAITTQTSKRYIIITDSYGGYRDADNNRLIDLIGTAFNCSQDDLFAYGGKGFTNANRQGTFLEALQNETVANPITVTDIIVIGGQNDYGRNSSDISNAIAAFITYCKTTFPNALVSIANASKSRCLSSVNPSTTMMDGVISSYYACLAYRACVNYGARYLKGTEYIMHNAAYYQSIDSPHPNATGVSVLATKIIEAIKTGSCSVYYSKNYDLTAPTATGYTITVPTAGALAANVIDGITQVNVSVTARKFVITFNSPTHMIDGNFTIAEPADNTALLALGQTAIPYGLSFSMMARCFDSSNNYLGEINGACHIGNNGELIANFLRGSSANPNNIKTVELFFTGTVASYQSILC